MGTFLALCGEVFVCGNLSYYAGMLVCHSQSETRDRVHVLGKRQLLHDFERIVLLHCTRFHSKNAT